MGGFIGQITVIYIFVKINVKFSEVCPTFIVILIQSGNICVPGVMSSGEGLMPISHKFWKTVCRKSIYGCLLIPLVYGVYYYKKKKNKNN